MQGDIEIGARVSAQRDDNVRHFAITLERGLFAERMASAYRDDKVFLIQGLLDEPCRDIVQRRDRDVDQTLIELGKRLIALGKRLIAQELTQNRFEQYEQAIQPAGTWRSGPRRGAFAATQQPLQS